MDLGDCRGMVLEMKRLNAAYNFHPQGEALEYSMTWPECDLHGSVKNTQRGQCWGRGTGTFAGDSGGEFEFLSLAG